MRRRCSCHSISAVTTGPASVWACPSPARASSRTWELSASATCLARAACLKFVSRGSGPSSRQSRLLAAHSMTDEQRRVAWLLAEHAALSCESAVVSLGPRTQDPGLATLLMDAAYLRRVADDLYQDIALRISAGTLTRKLH